MADRLTRAAAADEGTRVERLVRADRVVIGAGIGFIALLAWVGLILGAGTGMSPFAMTTWHLPAFAGETGSPAQGRWPPAAWLVMLAMWWVMMIAMMAPSAAPMILLYGRVVRHGQPRGATGDALVPAGAFAAGYLAVWLAFSAAATALQWALERAGLMHAAWMASNSATLSAALLIAAGTYQLSPLKTACLSQCRSPMAFLSRRWRPGRLGALRMGAAHGAFCVGCCAMLMALLFAGGVMNLLWIAGLSIFVLAEKLVPAGMRLDRAAGLVLLAAGAIVLIAGYG